MSKKPPTLTIVPTVEEVLAENVPARESTLDRVYRENGVTQEMINRQPRFTKVWESMGGFAVAAEYLRGSEDPDAIKFMEVYDRVPLDEHDFLEFQGFCAAAGVSGKKLFGIIAAEAAVEANQKIALVSAIKSPDVIDFTLEMAMTPGGHRERALVAKASGYTPAPKGSNLIVNNGRISAGNTVNVNLPPFDQDIREMGEEFQKMVPVKDTKLLEGE
jgi:hypothetical protein